MQADGFDLGRFLHAQAGVYNRALAELQGGQKRTHWMWFIFPQIAGLGHSSTSHYYAIKSEAEARQYLNHPVLGARLVQCAEALLAVEGISASAIFGFPDDVKLKSSMTLFATITPPESPFARVLGKYFAGQQDEKTIALLAQLG